MSPTRKSDRLKPIKGAIGTKRKDLSTEEKKRISHEKRLISKKNYYWRRKDKIDSDPKKVVSELQYNRERERKYRHECKITINSIK